MKVQCDNCGASYNVPDEKVGNRPFRFTCKKCKNVVRVKPKQAEPGKMTMEMPAAQVEESKTDASSAAFDENAATVFGDTATASAKPRPQPEKSQKPAKTPKDDAADENDGEIWYAAVGGDRSGPMTAEDLRIFIGKQTAGGDILVWRSGFDNWQKYNDVAELAEVEDAGKQALPRKSETAASQPPAAGEKAAKPRPSFTELIKQELGDSVERKDNGESGTQKIDISELMAKAPVKEDDKAAQKSAQAARKDVTIEEYVPPTKKKIPWIPIFILTTLFCLVVGTPLTLAYKHVIEIPGLDQVPVIGVYFKKEEVDHYAKLREQWEMLVKIEETKIELQATKEEEERQRLEEERQKALAEKRERMRRSAERRRRMNKSGKGASVMEIDFGAGPDGTEMDTEGELDTTGIERKNTLTQAQVNDVIRKSMGNIAGCVAQQKQYGKLSGTMVMRLTISRRGSVVHAAVVTNKFKGSYLGDCVASTIERIRFPRSGSSITVNYPFNIK